MRKPGAGDRARAYTRSLVAARLGACLIIAVGAIASRLAFAAGTAELPPRMTLAEAIATFRRHSFDLLIAEIGIDSARADQRAAAAIANPSVAASIGKSFSYDASCAGCSDVGWSVSLSDQGALSNVLTGKRGLRVDVAKAAVEAAKMSRDDAARTLELALEQQYVAAALAQASLRFVRQAALSASQTADLVGVRYRVGAVSEADLAKAETAKLEADQATDAAVESLRVAKVTLFFLLGTRAPAGDFEVDADVLRQKAPAGAGSLTRERLVQLAFEHRPDLKVAALQIEGARASIVANRRLRVPDIGLLVDFSQQGTGQNAIQPPTLAFGISFPLPIFYRWQGEIAKAEADLRVRTVLFARAQARVVADVDTAHAAFLGASSRVERMETRLLERAARARDLAQVQYEKGAASLLELLDAQRTFFTTSLEYLADLADYRSAVFALESAVGAELVP
jgi:cobalt-zinc-cadmium efflux system outer membrane protein